MKGPIRSVQILNCLEVAVPRNQDHSVTFRRRGNPDIVFRQRPAPLLQVLLQTSVFASDFEIARDNRSSGCESFHPIRVLRRTAGFRGAEEQLTERDSGNEHFGGLIQIGQYGVIPSSRAIMTLVSSRNLPFAGTPAGRSRVGVAGNGGTGAEDRSAGINALAFLLDGLNHLTGRKRIEGG